MRKFIFLIIFNFYILGFLTGDELNPEDILKLPYPEMFKALKDLKPTEGLTDAAFSRTDPVMTGKLYHMLFVLDKVLRKHKIPYWIDGGILLGAIRHGGLIPWDDDGDIEVFEKDWKKIYSLEKEFMKYGYEFRGINSLKPIGEDFPFVDILFTEKENDKIVLHGEARKLWPDNWFYKDEIFPGQRIKVGPIKLHAARNPERYLKTHYGDDCFNYAICWQHSKIDGNVVPTFFPYKAKIIDFSPAPYILPKKLK